jgi:hypothetical protein
MADVQTCEVGTITAPLHSESAKKKRKATDLREIRSCQCENINVEYNNTVNFYLAFGLMAVATN